jgi:hypothetical protein
VTEFKEGDRVKVRKLSEAEFEKTYVKNDIYGMSMRDYSNYINRYSEYFDKISIVEKIFADGSIDLIDVKWGSWYPEELEKVSTFKLRLQLIKELIK